MIKHFLNIIILHTLNTKHSLQLVIKWQALQISKGKQQYVYLIKQWWSSFHNYETKSLW